MIQGVKLSDLSANGITTLINYQHCLSRIVCNPPSPSCYMGSCDACPGIDVLRSDLIALLDENFADNITFKQWVSVDRSTLETYSTSSDEFVDMFCEKLELLCPHYFIAHQQVEFYKDCKLNLSPEEILVILLTSQKIIHLFCKTQFKGSIGTTHRPLSTLLLAITLNLVRYTT